MKRLLSTICCQPFKIAIFCLFLGPQHFTQAQQAVDIEEETPAQAQEKDSVNQLKFNADDNFMLSARYYAGRSDSSAVLLLHDCDHDSSDYEILAEQLSQYGVHALALDLRGFGASTSNEFSHLQIKRNSKDINTYRAELARLSSFWQGDILTAYNYLRTKIEKTNNVAVVAAGCTAPQAIFLAQKMRINSFVMLTPILNYMEKEYYKNLIDIPALFITSAHHANTYQTSKELFQWNGDNASTLQTFKGIRQGQSLLNAKKFLSLDIALWLDNILSKSN